MTFSRRNHITTRGLFGLKNVVLAPHLESATYGARDGMAELVARNLIAFKTGKIPPTLVNGERF